MSEITAKLEEQAKKIKEALTPDLVKFIQDFDRGEVKKALQEAVPLFQQEGYDQAIKDLGEAIGLAPEKIAFLQTLDDQWKETTGELGERVQTFTDIAIAALKARGLIDPNETIQIKWKTLIGLLFTVLFVGIILGNFIRFGSI